MTRTPLPDLERELHAAARRLERTVPRRRWWRHGWALLGIALVTTGVGVAAARVAHLGPFAYLDRFGAYNPKLAATSTITVEPPGDAPAWKAIALVNRLGQVCITGGPRDPRTNPSATPTGKHLNNPPSAGMTCADSDEIAQALIDPNWPGTTFASNSPLDGSPDVNMSRRDRHGHERRLSHDFPTRMLVYGVAPRGVTPEVRWYRSSTAIPMIATHQILRVPVDKSPDGLSVADQRTVAAYPDELELVLWAAPVQLPAGVWQAQVIGANELMPHGVADTTIEMITERDLLRLNRAGIRRGWQPRRGIRRSPPPVAGETAADRRWIAAFARPRSQAEDRVPARWRTRDRGYERMQYAASRRLTLTGGGLRSAWVVPGGLPLEVPTSVADIGRVCVLGTPIISQCENGAGRWKRPFVEAVVCAKGLPRDQTLVWAFTPRGARSIAITESTGSRTALPLGDLVAIRRRTGDRVRAISWRMADGSTRRVRVPWPKRARPRCGPPPGYTEMRRDSDGGSSLGREPLP